MATRTAGLLLAAGAGRRYGMPKALVERDGRLLVERGLATLRTGGCDPVVVVLGAAADEVRAHADLSGAYVVYNPDWADGMGSSLRTGLAALVGTLAAAETVKTATLMASTETVKAATTVAATETVDPSGTVEAVAILLVDTPGITPEAVRRVLAGSGDHPADALVVATYHGQRGHPVLLGRDHWTGAADLADGDIGARPYLRVHHAQVLTVPCEEIADGTDIDEP